ncbi:hypothetical protein [Mesorhizobium sp. WSM3224]|uniref:hypothetical protein n=1 Tax=Mesorhizobium sp. WSM3224 TaxID=1040986 RepID=UPI0012EC0801|nr:hypothetical protein [Mesorhizobium sp. WSM3224]
MKSKRRSAAIARCGEFVMKTAALRQRVACQIEAACNRLMLSGVMVPPRLLQTGGKLQPPPRRFREILHIADRAFAAATNAPTFTRRLPRIIRSASPNPWEKGFCRLMTMAAATKSNRSI